ncbi:MAG: hypothetical protein ACRDD1_15720, partial [Planctomycetia bacterium]
MEGFLSLGPRLTLMPVLHGSGDMAVRVREELLSGGYDCLAVPLPGSFADAVLAAVDKLPAISAVVQLEGDGSAASYIPIEPCQPVVAALRAARSERIAIEFIDLERQFWRPTFVNPPDPYALKRLS